MKITLELTKDEALALAAELHRIAGRRRLEATYRRTQGEEDSPLADDAKLYQRLSTEIFEEAL